MAYKCFCTSCGWRGESEKLVFNFGKLLKKVFESCGVEKTVSGKIASMSKPYSVDYLITVAENGGRLSISDSDINEIFKKLELDAKLESAKNVTKTLKDGLSLELTWRTNGNDPNSKTVTQIKVGYGGQNAHIDAIRLCPNCNAMVSSFAGLYPEITISILGSKRASKTTTLIASLFQLKSYGELTFENNIEIKQQWSNTDELIKIYEKNIAIAATETVGRPSNDDSAAPAVAASRPFYAGGVFGSYLITIAGKKTLISLIDVPGEFVSSAITGANQGHIEEFITRYDPIYENLDYLWICVDEVVLKRNTLDENPEDFAKSDLSAKYGYGENLPDSLGNLAYALGRLHTLGNVKGVAFIWGKIDQLQPINAASGFPPPFDNMGGYNGCRSTLYKQMQNQRQNVSIETNNIRKLSAHVKSEAVLRKDANGNIIWDNRDAIREICQLFDGRLCFFATSNYGHKPNAESGETAMETINPMNTELPLFWTLAMAGYMKIHHRTERRLFSGPQEFVRYVKNDDDAKNMLCLGDDGIG